MTGWVFIRVLDADFDSALAVYTGTVLTGLSEVGSSDRAFFGIEDVMIEVTAGTDYVIAVDGFSTTGAVDPVNGVGAFDLRISPLPIPGNDAFANAFQLPSSLEAGEFEGRTIQATAEANEPAHAGRVAGNVASNSVWYRWIAPEDALVGFNVGGSFDSVRGPDFDYAVSVYIGNTIGGLTEIALSDFFGMNAAERAVFNAVEGTEYRFAVDGFSTDGSVGQIGRFNLEVYEVPPNDDYFSAERLGSVLNLAVEGTTLNASSEFPFGEPEHAAIIAGNATSNSVWYLWTAPSNADMTLDVRDVAFNPVIAVYTGGSVSTLTEVAAADSVGDGADETVDFTATAGVTYSIVVDNFSTTGRPAPGGTFTLELSGTEIGGGAAPFETWIARFPSLSGDDAQPDGNPSGDGVSNLLKLVLGLDPTMQLAADPNRVRFPELITAASGNQALRYTVSPANLGSGAQAITHGGQLSSDLTTWVSTPAINIGGNTWQVELPEASEAEYIRIIATIP